MPTGKHQINVHDLNEDCTLFIASSAGKSENKRIRIIIDLVRQSIQFDVIDKINAKGKLCSTIEEAVEVYNEI